MKITATHWQQLSELLDKALDVAEDERLQWLSSLPEDLAALKATLQELLAQSAGIETSDCLAKPPDFAAALLAEYKSAQWAEMFQIDNIIGSYRLIRELGCGGMGSVWLAERVDGKFKRQVALKFPYAGPNQRQLAERLAREREILAGLEHRNIARLYDADVTASGQPFLVLEYINGVPITEYCDQQQLTIDERLKVFQQVLEAVCYAHANLVIHRDLKPSNILITADGIVHLLDFGIAKFVADGEVHETALTHIGGRALTPDYASPEQLAREPVTTASDVYSLGVLLYELLTGNRPYRLQRDTPHALEEAIEKADIALPSRADITAQVALNRNASVRQLKKLLTGDLDTLILKALKRNLAERYGSADAFLDDVRRYINREPILAQPDSQWYRLRKFVLRNRVVVASLAAIMIALMTGTGIALWQAHQAKLERDRAVAAAGRSEAASDFVELMMTEVADGNQPITMDQLIARSENIANRTYVGDAGQQAAILEILGSYYLRFGHAEKANEAYSKALTIAEKGPDQVLRAELLCASAWAEFALGKPRSAQQSVMKGISMTDSEPYTQAVCLETRAFLKSMTDDLNGAVSDLQRAQERLLKSGVNKPDFEVSLLMDMAGVYADLGRSDADGMYVKAAALLDQLGRGETSTAINLQNNWGAERGEFGDQLGALQHVDNALKIVRKHGLNVDQDSTYAMNRAVTLHHLGRDEEAIAIYQRVITSAQKDGTVALMASAKQGMAQCLLALGHISEAEKFNNEVVHMIGKELPANGIYSNGAVGIQGAVSMKLHHYQDAIRKFSEFIDASIKSNMPLAYLAYGLTRRGEAYLAERNFSSALIDAAAAWDKSRKLQGKFPCSNFSGSAALLFAKIYHAKNENDEARKWALIAFQQLQGSVGTDHPDTREAKQLLDSVTAARQT